ncbi:tissue development protein family [Trichomonas vaginalis G3]|uniref:helicase n=1 Tax=Trichomonas vaginalis (strain ATCC PRA-98 / G3) TaxID=412133 RepID=UPI0021E5D5AA|nr:helicase [Trichomonas vaginalis G3]KAI5549613.1 tissue development protein family [Trichomonas vaginalis G3]
MFTIIEQKSENGIWIKARKCDFATVNNVEFGAEFGFVGNDYIKFQDVDELSVVMKMRPGATTLEVPSKALFLNISHNEDLQINFGSMIHIDHTREQGIKPVAMKIQSYLNTPFLSPMLQGYLDENINDLLKFKMRGRAISADAGDEYFVVTTTTDNSISHLNFIPKNQEIIKLIERGIKILTNLAPFTPQSILLILPYLNCSCILRGYGIDKMDNDIIFFDDPVYKAYQVTKTTLEYLRSKKKYLADQSCNCTIAITGEDMSFSFDPAVDEEEQDSSNLDYVRPHTKKSCDSVFGHKYNYSHLVVLSKDRIPNATEIPWIKKGIYAEYTTETLIAALSANIFRSGVQIRYTPWINLYPHGANVNIKGTLPRIDQRDADLYASKEPMGRLINMYEMGCVKGQDLIQNVDLQDFEVTGSCDFGKSIGLYFKMQRENTLISLAEMRNILSMIRNRQFAQIKNMTINNLLKNENILSHLIAIAELFEQNYENIRFSDNCITIGIKNPLDVNKDVKNLEQILQCFNINHIEVVPVFQISIFHLREYKMDKDQFVKEIDSVLKRFGKIVINRCEYKELKTAGSRRSYKFGSVNISVCSTTFLGPIVSLIKEKLIKNRYATVRVPDSIVPKFVNSNKEIIKTLIEYFNEHKLNIKREGYRYIGSEKDVMEAEKLFVNDPPKIPVTIVDIAANYNVNLLEIAIRRNRRSWKISKISRIIVAPSNESKEKVIEFMNKFGVARDTQSVTEEDDKYPACFGDEILCHEDPSLQSKTNINMFLDINTVVSRPICLECAKETIKNNLGTIVDGKGNIKIQDVLGNAEFVEIYQFYDTEADNAGINLWPFVPFGHLMWTLLSSTISHKETKAYITTQAARVFHKSSKITFCPVHPQILMKTAVFQTQKCTFKCCRMEKCANCNNWHRIGDCKKEFIIPPGNRKCPYCGTGVEKTIACNHLKCVCGKTFCYYCGKKMEECKVADHQWMEAPDYCKYVLKRDVTDAELNRFYNDYPYLRPKNN